MDVLQLWPYLVIFCLCVIGYRLLRIQKLLTPQKEVPKYEENPLTKRGKRMVIGVIIILVIFIVCIVSYVCYELNQ